MDLNAARNDVRLGIEFHTSNIRGPPDCIGMPLDPVLQRLLNQPVYLRVGPLSEESMDGLQ